jgi:hypothetical protein
VLVGELTEVEVDGALTREAAVGGEIPLVGELTTSVDTRARWRDHTGRRVFRGGGSNAVVEEITMAMMGGGVYL